MSERVPAGAFAECAKLEKSAYGPRPALDARAKALTAMRTAVNEHDELLKQLVAIDQKLTTLLARPW
jgi:hypothetical protein